MNIEICEDVTVSTDKEAFLPPVLCAVKSCSRSPFLLVSVIVMFLFSLCLTAHDFLIGVFILPVSLFLLVSNCISFKKAGKVDGNFGLKLKRTAFLISAFVLAAFVALNKIDYTNALLFKLSNWLNGFTFYLPKPFNDVINGGFLGNDLFFATLAVSFLWLGLVYGFLNRSHSKNLPFRKTAFFSFLVNLALSMWLVYDGLCRLDFVPSNYMYTDFSYSLKLSRYIDAALVLAFALCLLLFAIHLLKTYIKLRKVRNAVLKKF